MQAVSSLQLLSLQTVMLLLPCVGKRHAGKDIYQHWTLFMTARQSLVSLEANKQIETLSVQHIFELGSCLATCVQVLPSLL